MASTASAKRQYTHVINVLDKVTRFSNAGWVDGKVVEIKEKRKGRQRVMVSTYVLKFEDMPSTRLERDFEATGELVDFTYQKKHGTEAITSTNWNQLAIVGVKLLTKSTLEMNLVAGGPRLHSGLWLSTLYLYVNTLSKNSISLSSNLNWCTPVDIVGLLRCLQCLSS